MKTALLVITSLLTIGEALSQEIRVVNNNHQGIPNATIVVVGTENDVIEVLVTDPAGMFNIRHSVGTLNITAPGFESRFVNIADIGKSGNIILENAAIVIDVVQVAPRIEMARKSGGRFVVSNIAFSPFAKGVNSMEMLRFMPLLNADPTSGAIEVLNRGAAKILINGRRSDMSAQEITAMLSSMPATDVDRIEITPIPGARYGSDEQSGILNIILRKRPNEGTKLILTAKDSYTYFHEPSLAARLSMTTKKSTLTFGAATDYSNDKHISDGSYVYSDVMQRQNIADTSRSKGFSGSGFFHWDYRINDRQTFGARVNGSLTDVSKDHLSQTLFSKLNGVTSDSIYNARFRSTLPELNGRLGGSLYYDRITDDRGSVWKTDIAYQHRNSSVESSHISNRLRPGLPDVRVEDFITRRDVTTDIVGLTSNYLHIFGNESELESGIRLLAGRNDNDYFYGTVNNLGGYPSDHTRSNRFVTNEFTAAAFANYDIDWSDKWSTGVGLRLESYNARGEQKASEETVKRKNVDILPSVNVVYALSDEHELSLDATLTTSRPAYTYFNNFREYLSPTVYKQGNPYLKSTKGIDVLLDYSFFDDYSLSINYYYEKDPATFLYMPVGDNMTKQSWMNYCSSSNVDISLSGTIELFGGRLYLLPNVSFLTASDKGKVEDIDLTYRTAYFQALVDFRYDLLKKAKISLTGRYYYRSGGKGSSQNFHWTHHGMLTAIKQFKNSSLSASVISHFGRDDHRYWQGGAYIYDFYDRKRSDFRIEYAVRFGNSRIKNTANRSNTDIEQR